MLAGCVVCRRFSRSRDLDIAVYNEVCGLSADQNCVVRTWYVAMTPRCCECDREWLADDPARWRAYRTDADPDDPPEFDFWCADCAEREFDE